MRQREISRREFLKLGVAGMAVLVLPIGCGRPGAGGARGKMNREGQPSTNDDGRFFDDHQYATIRALTGVIIPEDQDPGAVSAGVVDYIDYMLGAFEVDPPRIYAAGPFSGRHGGEANFGDYLPLSRVQEISWRMYIQGSQGIAEREFNGPVVGLQEIYATGVTQFDALSQTQFGADFVDLTPAEQATIKKAADKDFINVVFQNTVEGMYAAPEYGGNQEMMGWKYVNYEGDRQPIGYSRAQIELSDPTGVLSSRELDEVVQILRLAFAPYKDQLL